MQHDRRSGLYLPEGARPDPPPNPTEAPPVPLGFLEDLKRLGRRLHVEYRPHWHKMLRCWTIQEKRPGEHGDIMGWATIMLVTDADRATKKHPRVYQPLDRRCLDELVTKIDLEQRFNTGDREKDRQLFEKEKDDRIAKEVAADDEREIEEIANILHDGDPLRMGRLIAHEAQHGEGGGTGFKEFHQVARKAPVKAHKKQGRR